MPRPQDIAAKAAPFIKRIEFLEEEKQDFNAQKAEERKIILEEAERAGLPPKAMRVILRRRKAERAEKAALEKLDIDERAKAEALLDAQAAERFGDDTPMGQHLQARADAGGHDESQREDEDRLQRIGRGKPESDPLDGIHA